MSYLRDVRRRPTHPGALLREDVLPALKVTQAEFAEHVGLSAGALSDLLLEKTPMSPETACRIAGFLKTTPDSWLRMQEAVDVWNARQQPA